MSPHREAIFFWTKQTFMSLVIHFLLFGLMVTSLMGVTVSSKNTMYAVSTLERMLKSSPESLKNKPQSVNSNQPFIVCDASSFQMLMVFCDNTPVFNCDLYFGSSRMTLWSHRPRWRYKTYAPGIFPKHKSSMLGFLVGVVTYFFRRYVEISNLLKSPSMNTGCSPVVVTVQALS